MRFFLVILALVLAPVLTSMDMGKARAVGHHPAVEAGACAESCASHQRTVSTHHGGIACTVSCATAAFFPPMAAMAPPMAATGQRRTLPRQHVPAKASWPPPLPPPRS